MSAERDGAARKVGSSFTRLLRGLSGFGGIVVSLVGLKLAVKTRLVSNSQ